MGLLEHSGSWLGAGSAARPRAAVPLDAPGGAAREPSEALLGAVLESVDCGILFFGAGGELRAANNRLAEMLRIDAAELHGLGHFDEAVGRLAPRFAQPEVVAARWRERRQNDEACWDDLELTRPAGKILERFARPVFDHSGARVGWLEIYRDLTTQRLAETKLLHTDRMAALGQLVSGIVHELNNPLTSILGYAQLLNRRRTSVRNGEAQQILEQAERASRIAKNLLLFARESKTERGRVNLNEVVQRTLALRSYELRLENIQVESLLDPRLPAVVGDAAQLQQVLLNLLLNAEQALQLARSAAAGGSEPARITLRTRRVSTERAGERAAMEVIDNGPGIAGEVLPRIFDPFFTTKPADMGTGLGLSIVYGIVQDHGGEVLVESGPGEGAGFRVELPVAKSMAVVPRPAAPARSAPLFWARDDRVGRRANERRGPAAATHRERVLVVEDEPTVARLIADVLGEEGHTVDTMLDSREALERVARVDYDLLICDLRMPHLDGRAVYRELLRRESPLARRLIFVTGDTLAPRTVEFLEESGLPCLAKPFLVEELKDAVHGALAAQAGGRAAEHVPAGASRWRGAAPKKR